MPEYSHICIDENCNNKWEENYSIKSDPPKICPKCQKETAKRIISGRTLGKVELTGHEFDAKHKESIQQLKKDMYSNENVYANLLSPEKYQGLQTKLDTQKKDGVFRRK